MKLFVDLVRKSNTVAGVLALVLGLSVAGCADSTASSADAGGYHACRSCRKSETACSSGRCPYATTAVAVDSPDTASSSESTVTTRAVPASYETTAP